MRVRYALPALLLFVACRGENRIPPSSFIKPDATVGADDDGGATVPDASVIADAGTVDAGTSMRDSGMLMGPTAQIIAVRLSPPGPQAPSLPVSGVFVTYVRAALGDDPAGFFVQFERNGPALFIAVDPTTLTPVPAAGDEVAFAVADTEVVDAQHRVLAISSWTVNSSGNDVSGLVQDLTAATDVVNALSSYESELISIDATITGAPSPAGTGYRRAPIATAGLPNAPQLVLRAEASLFDSLGLAEGCAVSVGPTPMWRFQTTAQVMALVASEINVTGCANGPRLVQARAASDTTVELTFDRPIAAATAGAAAFTITPGLTVSGAVTTDNVVTLTTSMMGELVPYTVTVADTVTDTFGNALDMTANSANFVGPSNAVMPTAAGQVIFSEIMQNPAAVADTEGEYLEVYNTTSTTFDLAGCRILDEVSDDHAIGLPLIVPAGGYATLARSAMPGFTPDYVYTNVTLGNGTDRVVLTCAGTEIDRVEWDGGVTFPDPNGRSMNLSPMSLDGVSNDLGGNWCEATSSFGNDAGTPGFPNDTCVVMTPPDAGVIDAGDPDAGAGAPDAGMGPVDGGGGVADAGVADGGTPDAGPPPMSGLVINEVDYDSPGTDDFEFIELLNASPTPIDLTNISLAFINGSNNTEYRRVDLTGTLANGAYLVIANTGVTVAGGVTVLTIPSNGVQNGSPDGLALIDVTNSTVIDAISYEGSITAAMINGFPGTVSLVEGTAATAVDNNATVASIVRLPNGADTNDADTDWAESANPTPGAANVP